MPANWRQKAQRKTPFNINNLRWLGHQDSNLRMAKSKFNELWLSPVIKIAMCRCDFRME
jgi:hypothetical protein